MFPILLVFLVSYLNCNAMDDFPNVPLATIVGKTPVEDTNPSNPVSFHRIGYPKNLNQHITSAGGSFDDPTRFLRLPSASDRGMVLRPSDLVLPGWLRERPREYGPPQGQNEKQHGSSPGALITGLKRKTTEVHNSINSSHLPGPAVSSSIETILPRKRGFRLLGFDIIPEGCAKEPKVDKPLKEAEKLKTSLVPEITRKVDEYNMNLLLSKHHVETSSSRPYRTYGRLSYIDPTSRTPPSVSKNMIGSKVQLYRQDQTTMNANPYRLQFDADLLKSFAPSGQQPGLSFPLNALGKGEIVMTEAQFVKYHGRAFLDYKLPKPAELHPSNRLSGDTHRSRKLNTAACRFLSKNLSPWIRRYEEQMELDLESCVGRISAASGKSRRSIEKLTVTYLLFVEMMSTIVPRERDITNIKSELEYALKLLESIYEIEEPNDLIHDPALESKRRMIKEILGGLAVTDDAERVWHLLDIWMATSRSTLYEAITCSNQLNKITNHTKHFSGKYLPHRSKGSHMI
ncbi:hypothetical protein KEM48_008396 [Puccinia striiformis f. sp. tritici PST-130]|nr:hypothetical protein KEM48_008396 [Puccinia striiformis f. sp. tritici PST-130]